MPVGIESVLRFKIAPALRWIAAGKFLERAAEIICMTITQFVGDFLHSDSIFFQQLDCLFHANAGVICGDRFVQMCPEKAIERYGGYLKVFAKRSDRTTFAYVLSQPAQGQFETEGRFRRRGIRCL